MATLPSMNNLPQIATNCLARCQPVRWQEPHCWFPNSTAISSPFPSTEIRTRKSRSSKCNSHLEGKPDGGVCPPPPSGKSSRLGGGQGSKFLEQVVNRSDQSGGPGETFSVAFGERC